MVMSTVYIMGDMHLGQTDRQIKRWWPKWDSAEEHDAVILDNWKRTVKRNDLVYVLGDIGNDLLVVSTLPGRKILVMGNHDARPAVEYLAIAGFNDIKGFVGYKRSWLSHCPIHPTEMRRRELNIHGHTHAGGPSGPYFNACAEHIDHTPIKYSTIEEIFL